MIENIMVSLGLMFVSGITFIAYKHPDLYDKKFFGKLNAAAAVIYFGSQLYDAAVSSTFKTLKEFITPENLDKAVAAKDSLAIPIYIIAVAVALWVYSFFLSWLAHHMQYSINRDKH